MTAFDNDQRESKSGSRRRVILAIPVLPASKAVGAVSFVFSVLVLVPFATVIGLQGDSTGLDVRFLLLAPLLYALLGFGITAGLCFLYNIIAPRLGGIEFEVADDGD